MQIIRVIFTAILIVATMATLLVGTVAAEEPGNTDFFRTWQRTDWPVQQQLAQRSWVWGPEAFTAELSEPYAEASGNARIVQYYDKSRMEITFPNGARSSPFYVTNGLLVVELITGRLQLGDNTFEDRNPAMVNVAGDAGDPAGPTYATFGSLLDAAPHPVNEAIVQIIDRAGRVSSDAGLAAENVQIAIIDDVTNHAIPQPFWDFMNASGPIVDRGTVHNRNLFENPFFATGRPITEAYWATVQVAGTERQVLMQCFERRCLTYTPGNSPGFITEAGNVGQHYFAWRYDTTTPDVLPLAPIPTQATWRQIASPGPGGRSDHSLAADPSGDRVYLFGGRAGGVDLGDFWAFDLETEQWMHLSSTGPSPRFGHNAAYDPRRNRVVIYGGESAAGFFSDVWAWDVAAESWSLLATGGGPLARYGAVGTFDPLTNSLLVSHGFTSSGRFDDSWRFDLASDSWEQISPGAGFTRPEARCLVRGVADPLHGKLYLFGGQSNTAGYLNDLWSYDLAARTWTQINGNGPAPRNLYAATAGADHRYMLIHGGNVGGVAGSDLWLLDFATGEWQSLVSANGDAPAMSGHDAAWTTAGLFVFGGSGQTWIATLN